MSIVIAAFSAIFLRPLLWLTHFTVRCSIFALVFSALAATIACIRMFLKGKGLDFFTANSWDHRVLVDGFTPVIQRTVSLRDIPMDLYLHPLASVVVGALLGCLIGGVDAFVRSFRRRKPNGDHKDVRPYTLDGSENRSHKILTGMDGVTAMRTFPDYDVAYIRAAYPTNNSGDHASAKPHFLEEGLRMCPRKSFLLARLSAYHVWKGNALDALNYAVNAVEASKYIETVPDLAGGCANLLAAVFLASGMSAVVRKKFWLSDPSYNESPKMKLRIAAVAKELSQQRYREKVTSAANRMLAKSWNL